MQSLDVISVNIWQILISLCNLVILFLILKKFLFKPVQKVTQTRRAELDDIYSEAKAAQTRAGELQTSFSHTRPSGASCFTALTEAGVSYARAGENIAYGQSTPEAVVQSWMSSSGHRANILSSSFTTIGIGCTVVNGTAYWAQLFTA